jgi:hypothetical protein
VSADQVRYARRVLAPNVTSSPHDVSVDRHGSGGSRFSQTRFCSGDAGVLAKQRLLATRIANGCNERREGGGAQRRPRLFITWDITPRTITTIMAVRPPLLSLIDHASSDSEPAGSDELSPMTPHGYSGVSIEK